MARGNNLELRGAAMSSIKWRLAVPARKWRLQLLDEGCYFLLPPLLPFIQLKGRTPLWIGFINSKNGKRKKNTYT